MAKGKNLAKLIGKIGLAGMLSLGGLNKTEAQEIKKDSLEIDSIKNKELNFYSNELTGYEKILENPEYYSKLWAWLSNGPKEKRQGHIWLFYGDTDGDGFYDYAYLDYFYKCATFREEFQFDIENKEIDYTLGIYKYEGKSVDNSETIVKKFYKDVTQKEASHIGEEFSKRVGELLLTQKKFSRFNVEPLEKLIREEYTNRIKIEGEEGNYKIFGNPRVPLEKFFSEEEIKYVEKKLNEKEREVEKKEKVYIVNDSTDAEKDSALSLVERYNPKENSLINEKNKKLPNILDILEAKIHFAGEFNPSIGFGYSCLKKSPKGIYNGFKFAITKNISGNSDVSNAGLIVAYKRFNPNKSNFSYSYGINYTGDRSSWSPIWPFFEFAYTSGKITIPIDIGFSTNSIFGAGIGYNFSKQKIN